MPVAVLKLPVVAETRALQPRAELVAVVQPRTIPPTVGVAAQEPSAIIQAKPSVQAAQAVRTYPSVPTARATGVFVAVATTRSPFAVRIVLGIISLSLASSIQTPP